MKTSWTSPNEVAQYFGTTSTSSDLDALVRELEVRRNELHPDRTGGKFPSSAAEISFLEVQSSLNFLEAARSTTTMIPVSQLPAIIDSLAKALDRPTVALFPDKPQALSEIRKGLRGLSRVPKLTSGVLLAISTALFTFMGSLAEHPILGGLYGNLYLQLLLMLGCVTSGVFFLLYWWRDGVVAARAEQLISDDFLSDVLENLCWSLNLGEEQHPTFTARDINRLVKEQYDLDSNHKWQRSLNGSVAEAVTSMHLGNLLRRKVIKPAGEPDIVQRYEVRPEILSRHRAEHEDIIRRAQQARTSNTVNREDV